MSIKWHLVDGIGDYLCTLNSLLYIKRDFIPIVITCCRCLDGLLSHASIISRDTEQLLRDSWNGAIEKICARGLERSIFLGSFSAATINFDV